ncbi:serine/threonine receptor-like kinase NFP [Salvia miltiorrhiza]|uniref:serine/threonine receptor-like kinase NFP n=1 Tax=Salvia miltiorrhiza TaxID=226208 RepID=UPI0025AC9223|nr:serine/threonine receptor-like kinase NFP [Salvia miltiorrhiza]XP_057768479.1 serine/threonine receptor-like kinase NFP [Salvia miltiorrhiza]
MTISLYTILIIFSLFLIFVISSAASQFVNNTAVTDFRSSADSPTSCEAYITYRVRSPYAELGSISDLFGKSRLEIARATNLTSEDTPLVPNQLLLVPIICTTNGTHYFSNVTYKIKKDDTYYSVQVKAFQNLTEFHVVEEMNPKLNPTNLTVGEEVVFPLFCKCPEVSYKEKGIQFLTTYVWQPGDDVLPVSAMFQTTASDIEMANNNRNFTAAVCLPVLIPEKMPILLQLFPSSASHGKSKRQWILIASSSALALIILLGFTAFIFLSLKKKKMLVRSGSSLERPDLFAMYKASKDEKLEVKVQDKLLPGVSGYLGKPIVYDLNVILKATMNLSERYRIGGSVYKATINDQFLAVKKTRDATEEVQILQRVNHANLVKLMGVSSDNDGNFFIVYEYVENGSLDNWLSPKVSASSATVKSLVWSQRLVIALDVANGLHYMHEHTQPSIVHKDIRTSNILLDSNFRAKIANLSAARPATSSIMLNIDVFSFGVVLLELLSGKKVMETKDDGEVVMLWKEVKGILDVEDQRKERLRRWMDPNLKSSYPIDDALSLATLARACTSENSLERPSMGEVVFNLSVLTQSSPQMSETSWVSKFETEEVSPVNTPVEAR